LNKLTQMWITCALLIVALMSGCNSDYELPLVNGYVLARVQSHDVAVYPPSKLAPTAYPDNNGVAVGPRVTEYAVVKQFVIGRHKRIDMAYDRAEAMYFVVDTLEHEASRGLTEAEYKVILNEHGISGELPKLKKAPT